MTRYPIRLIPLLAAVCAMCAVAACSSAPTGPQITPVNATIKLGRVTEKTFLTRIDVANSTNNANYGGYGVGVGAAGASSGGGGGVGVGFSVDLTRLLSRQQPQPPQQMDLYQYKVQAMDGTVAQVNAPAAPGLEPGTCVRLIYQDGSPQPRMAPSNEC